MRHLELNINSDQVVEHTARLEKIHRSALPVAVRKALNDTAYRAKKTTIPKEASKVFINRAPGFFKATSSVEMAKGFNIKTMNSRVGFIKTKGKKIDQAVKDLEMQEHGGTIGGRSYIPMDKARQGGQLSRSVKKGFRLSEIEQIIRTRDVKAKSKKQQYIKAAIMANKLFGKNGFVKNNQQGRVTLSKIDSVTKSGGKIKITRTPIYSYKRGRKVDVKGTGFMKRASYESGLKMENDFIKEAEKQIKRLR